MPDLSGYSDEFDDETNKARMDLVPHAKMLDYAGGDTDATFRLAKVLLPLAKEDRRNWGTFKRVQMPALRAFVEMEENGVLIDREELATLETSLDQMEREAYAELIALVPPAVLRKHEGGWQFSRAQFTCDVLFSKDGLGLKPLVFTKATKNLPKAERIPSTSAKDHLPFFDENPFVQKLMSYQKLAKMRGTYVGSEGRSEVRPVKRTVSGAVPARLSALLADRGIVLPPSKAVRSRIQVLDAPVSFEVNANKRVLVDRCGNIAEVHISEPTGFWQFLRGWDKIHPSFLLHGTVTGRTSSRTNNIN